MSDIRKAAQAVLTRWDGKWDWLDAGPTADLMKDLRAALAEPEQEPVAWMVYTLDGKSVCVTDNPADFTDQHRALPLYTAPPQREPLTDEAVQQLYAACLTSTHHIKDLHGGAFGWLVRIIERAHGIGGEYER